MGTRQGIYRYRFIYTHYRIFIYISLNLGQTDISVLWDILHCLLGFSSSGILKHHFVFKEVRYPLKVRQIILIIILINLPVWTLLTPSLLKKCNKHIDGWKLRTLGPLNKVPVQSQNSKWIMACSSAFRALPIAQARALQKKKAVIHIVCQCLWAYPCWIGRGGAVLW